MPRFHLSFEYEGRHKGPSYGDEVLVCDSLEIAAKRLMIARGIAKIYIKNRYMFEKPSNEAEIINKYFNLNIDTAI